VTVYIGSERQPQALIVDTGSSVAAVPSRASVRSVEATLTLTMMSLSQLPTSGNHALHLTAIALEMIGVDFTKGMLKAAITTAWLSLTRSTLARTTTRTWTISNTPLGVSK